MRKIRSITLLVMIFLSAGAATARAQLLKVGEKVPDFRFERVVLNGDGRVSPGEFLGQPVLVEYWGFR